MFNELHEECGVFGAIHYCLTVNVISQCFQCADHFKRGDQIVCLIAAGHGGVDMVEFFVRKQDAPVIGLQDQRLIRRRLGK